MIVAATAGALAQVVSWVVVRRRAASLWSATAPVLVVAGIVAVAVAPPAISGERTVPLAAGAGLAVGVALYEATLLFVRVVGSRSRRFDAQARSVYASRSALAPPLGLAVGAIAAVGEELFWRGLVLEWASDAFGSQVEAGIATWAAYVLVNLASANLAIVAAAVVGGAVWTILAGWSGAVLASAVCHACWTSVMIARPVVVEGGAR